jgi:glyoxylase-like metal-dependent hydrolase (beta-lactamase superfamily II)
VAIEIIPLNCGRITQVEHSTQQYLTSFGQKLEAQVVVWLIKGGERIVLVDSGSGTPGLVERRFGRELLQNEGQRPEAALRAAGVEPEDVEVVVQTHLHWDHCLSLHEDPYPNAEFLIQRDELLYAGAPYPAHNALYDRAVVEQFVPTYGRGRSRVRVIEGDLRVMPGVSVIATPGHSPGLQAVLVQTETTRYAIASDNVPFHSSWRGPMVEDWIPPGVHVRLDDCYRSNQRLAASADVILPSHDPLVVEQDAYR